MEDAVLGGDTVEMPDSSPFEIAISPRGPDVCGWEIS